ncbi:MAG TPA: hypothetical protein VH275_09755 [Solirubrobacterales bacterium]|nr:hypothetical protein [Solirubrobacterales bacterium]
MSSNLSREERAASNRRALFFFEKRTSSMNKLLALSICALSLAIASIVTGCGSGEEATHASSSKSAPAETGVRALTKTEFIKQGDAICEKTDKRQEAGLKAYAKKDPLARATKQGQERMVAAVGLPPIELEAKELSGLNSPSGDESKLKAVVEGIEEALEKAQRNPISVLSGSGNPFNKVDKLAARYGFKACADAL